MAKLDIRTVPTTDLDIPYLQSLCRPVFDSVCPRYLIAWAGVFGSVGRGTQRSDSDVDIILGYSRETENSLFYVCDSMELLLYQRLPETLGRSVDLLPFVEGYGWLQYPHLEALLAAKTIWGDPSWPKAAQATAERLLRQEYSRTPKALDIMSDLQKSMTQIESEVASPESLHLSILSHALSIIDLFERPGPFHDYLKRMIPEFFDIEPTIRACLKKRKPIPKDTMEVLPAGSTCTLKTLCMFRMSSYKVMLCVQRETEPPTWNTQ